MSSADLFSKLAALVLFETALFAGKTKEEVEVEAPNTCSALSGSFPAAARVVEGSAIGSADLFSTVTALVFSETTSFIAKIEEEVAEETSNTCFALSGSFTVAARFDEGSARGSAGLFSKETTLVFFETVLFVDKAGGTVAEEEAGSSLGTQAVTATFPLYFRVLDLAMGWVLW